MAFFALTPHPASLADPASSVEVTIEVIERAALLRYGLPGSTNVIWPEPAVPARADGLWRSTCFELFLMFDDDERYVEFNFSPSGQWAAYVFDGYREGMADLPLRSAPVVARVREGVEVVCSLADLPHGEFRMGLSAVIEASDDARSYWALAHAPGPPDFHHPACFAATLPPPRTP